MAHTTRSELIGDHTSTATPLVVRELVIRSMHGVHLIGPVSFTASSGRVTLLTGADPAARWALASAVTGRLPMERMRVGGTVSVAGLTTPPLIRNASVLAQSWRIRGVADAAERRLAALAWARSVPVELILLSPGLDGLDEAGCRMVLEDAARVADSGRTVVITAPVGAAAGAELHLATVTIALPHGHNRQSAA